ncbi:PREDICTED: uncharacterized protein LOC108749819 [Trachymyrmex septentrionalis]|uniref:uncharacterized protein LOC108749819 n=1 Tax=Trachymyrmex septentrionalis TaxID=34720 RepID=UPI00084F28F1|nr:PREDICTED: uncharacterized protein LOC108749819 [Trachymyrmex septentrionalis]
MGGSSSRQAEPVNSEQTELSNGNESTITTVIAPPTIFATKDEFVRIWFSWKNDFFAYLKNIDKVEDKKQMWGFMLLNRMGPIGQEIHRTFHFYGEDKNTLDIDILIKKFDLYCLYGDKKRSNEDIDEYIHELKFFAIAQDYIDPMRIVKEKIIQDMSTQRFTGKAALLIESKGEKLISYLQSLDLYHIALFWKQCEHLMAQKIDETPKQNSTYANSATAESVPIEQNQNQSTIWGHRCKLFFPKLCCAHCNKCKQFNHYTDNYKDKYIYDCTKCGMSHIQSHCPAYGELCIKCGKRNHFSMMCRVPFKINCSKCGMNHAISRCPAQGRICRHCNQLNHLEEKCPDQPSVFEQVQSVY